jgi:hypothetical protein
MDRVICNTFPQNWRLFINLFLKLAKVKDPKCQCLALNELFEAITFLLKKSF